MDNRDILTIQGGDRYCNVHGRMSVEQPSTIRLLDKTFENIIGSYTNDSYNKM